MLWLVSSYTNSVALIIYGQMYVALSRVTSLSGLFLIDDYSHFLVADPTAAREY